MQDVLCTAACRQTTALTVYWTAGMTLNMTQLQQIIAIPYTTNTVCQRGPQSDWGCFRGRAISSSLGAPFY